MEDVDSSIYETGPGIKVLKFHLISMHTLCAYYSRKTRSLSQFFWWYNFLKKNITRQILNFILENLLKNYCVVLMFCEKETIGIPIKFSWSRKSHFELNIIRNEICIMNFCTPLFGSQTMYL